MNDYADEAETRASPIPPTIIRESYDEEQTQCIRWMTGVYAGTVLLLREHEITFGRSGSSTVTFDGRVVSNRHARMWHDPEKSECWKIEDLGSTNGTFVGGRLIDGVTPLQEGVEVSFGNPKIAGAVRFVFEAVSSEAEDANRRMGAERGERGILGPVREAMNRWRAQRELRASIRDTESALERARDRLEASVRELGQAVLSGYRVAVVGVLGEVEGRVRELEDRRDDIETRRRDLKASGDEFLALLTDRRSGAEAACEAAREMLATAEIAVSGGEAERAAIQAELRTVLAPPVDGLREAAQRVLRVLSQLDEEFALNPDESPVAAFQTGWEALKAAWDENAESRAHLRALEEALSLEMQALERARKALYEAEIVRIGIGADVTQERAAREAMSAALDREQATNDAEFLVLFPIVGAHLLQVRPRAIDAVPEFIRASFALEECRQIERDLKRMSS